MVKYSAIKDMYYGNRGQHENVRIKNEDIQVLDTIVECDENLRKKLTANGEVLKIYQRYSDAMMELNCIENEHCYIEGFKFGFLMALDVFNND